MFYADFSKISTFFLGMVAGATVVFIVVALLISKGKEKKQISGSRIEDIAKDKLNKMISEKQDALIYEVEENDKRAFKATMPLALELIKEIAKEYYPDSKYPEYELTIIEAFNLIRYILNQLEKLFNKPVLKPFKQVKVSFIVNAIDKSKQVKNNKIVKAASDIKNAGLDEAYKDYKIIKNTLNPIYWFRKVVIKGTLNAVVKKLCRTSLNIIGVEANKVYSKKDIAEVEVSDTEDFEEIISED